MKKWDEQETDLVFQLALEFREIEIEIVNKDRFPGAYWLEQPDFQSIGFAGGEALILVGWEIPDRTSPLVIKWDDPSVKGDLLAFKADYEGMDDEIRALFEEQQKDLDAKPDRLEFRALSLDSLLTLSPWDVNLVDYGSMES